MEDLINLILEWLHYIKYNSKKSYDRQLESAEYIDDARQQTLWQIVNNQYSKLLKQGNGVPAYVLFTHARSNWYKVVVINKEKKFHIRLTPEKIDMENLPKNFYISTILNGQNLSQY